MKSLAICFSVLVAACTPDNQKEILVIVDDTEEEEGTVVEDSDSETSSEEPSVNRHSTAEFCSVEIVFYFEDDEAVSIALTNFNDVAVIVDIYNTTTGGTTLQNCLWPQSEIWGGTDEENVNFSSSDKLELEIWLGQGISSDLCLQSIDSIIDSFDLCEDVTHEISFVFK